MTAPTESPSPLAERVLAERVHQVPPSGIRKFFDIAATMTDVISLGIGEPDFDTPRGIIEAGVESLREGRTHYTANLGTIELRRALAAHLERLMASATTRERAADHGRRVGGLDLALRATSTPATRSSSTSRPTSPTCRRSSSPAERGPRRDAVRGRLRARSGGPRGGDHAADQGAVPRLPLQPDRRRAARRGPGRDRPRSPSATTCSSTATRSTTGSPTARTAIGRSRRSRHARAHDPDGRLLEGLRDDRLADRLAGGAGRDHRGHAQDPPVRDHVRADRRPGRGPRRAHRRRARGRAHARRVRPATPPRRRRLQPLGLETFEPRGAFYAFPGHLDRARSASVRAAASSRRSTSRSSPAARSVHRARSTSAPATPRPTSASRRPCVRIGRFVDRVRPT